MELTQNNLQAQKIHNKFYWIDSSNLYYRILFFPIIVFTQ